MSTLTATIYLPVAPGCIDTVAVQVKCHLPSITYRDYIGLDFIVTTDAVNDGETVYKKGHVISYLDLTNSGHTAKQTVKLTFAIWDYRTERTVEVGGNCTGVSVIDCAISNLYEDLEDMSDGMGSMLPGIILADPNDAEKELHSTDDEERGDDWLKDMLIGAEIIAIRPDTEEPDVEDPHVHGFVG